MALTNAERQKRWRERHPEQSKARLEAFQAAKTAEKPCSDGHDGRGVRVQGYYCGKCDTVFIVDGQKASARARWQRRAPRD